MVEYVKLGDIINYRKGFAFKSSSYTDNGTMVVRVSDFSKDSVSTNDAVFIEYKDKYRTYKLHTGDILIQTVGSWANNPNSIVGKVVRVPSACDNSVLNQNIVKIYPRDEKMNNTYLFYSLIANKFSLYCVQRGQGAANQASITLETIFKFKFRIHGNEIQNKIASILSTYDTLIENNTKRIRLLEKMAENLYKEWFVRFRFPGHEKVEMENGLPKGWKVEKLGEWGINLDTGKRPKGGIDDSLKDGYPSLGAECIKELASFDYSSVRLVPKTFYDGLKRGKNTGNDILLYKDGAYIGKVTMFRDKFPYAHYAINEHVFFVSPKDKEYKNYLYFTLHQYEYFQLMQNLNRNAAQPGLSRGDVERIKMVIPSWDIITLYNNKVEPILKVIFKLAKQNTLLARQRDLLLPRLISGKLEV